MKESVGLLLVMVFVLAGCGGFSGTPTPLPTVVLDSGGVLAPTSVTTGTPGAGGASSAATASGVIVPARQAGMSSSLGGTVQAVDVAIGQKVEAGQALVELAGQEKVNAALENAKMELVSARVDLRTLKDSAEKARTDAMVRLADAKKALDDATKRRAFKDLRNGSQDVIEEAQANYILAQKAFDDASDNFAGYEDGDPNNINRAAALSALGAARHNRDKALANLNYLLGLPSSVEVEKAEAEYQAAKAEVDLAQAAFDKVKNGVDPDQLEIAESRVRNAEAQVAASQADLANLQLKAPFAGVVGKLDLQAGDWVKPGDVVVVVLDDTSLRVETSDLSERDVPNVKAGQAVSVFVKPLGQTVKGTVAEIAPLSDTIGGDVVYKTVIDLDQTDLPEGLRAGMSVDVTFEASKE